jgi:hypothetical protein
MAAVDANYCFIYAEVGCQGRISDGGVFKHTVLYDKLEREHLEIPLDAPLIIDHERTLLPFLFVADDAFPLRPIQEFTPKEVHNVFLIIGCRELVALWKMHLVF